MEFWFDAPFAAESKKAAKPRISTGFKDDVKVKNPLIH